MGVVNPVGYLQNISTHTAQVDRLASAGGLLLPSSASELRARGGVRMPGDLKVTANGTPNMSVNVSAGIAYVPAATAVAGTYAVPNDGSVNVPITAAHATLPRRDLIVVRVRDSFYSGSENQGDIIPITGVANASPVDPDLPAGASYLVLARVSVGINDTSITSGEITAIAKPVQLPGTIIPVEATDTTAPLYDYQFRIHPTFGPQYGIGGAWVGAAPKMQRLWTSTKIGDNALTASAFSIVHTFTINGAVAGEYGVSARMVISNDTNRSGFMRTYANGVSISPNDPRADCIGTSRMQFTQHGGINYAGGNLTITMYYNSAGGSPFAWGQGTEFDIRYLGPR